MKATWVNAKVASEVKKAIDEKIILRRGLRLKVNSLSALKTSDYLNSDEIFYLCDTLERVISDMIL